MLTQLVANTLIAGASYALFAMSFSLVYKVSGFLHIAHGAVYTVAAYSFFFAKSQLRLSWGVSVVAGMIAATVLCASVDSLVYRPLQKRKSSPNILLLASFGVLIIIQNIISALFSDGTKSVQAGVSAGISIIGARITWFQIVSLFAGALTLAGLTMIRRMTRWGMWMRAVAADPDLSHTLGLNTYGVRSNTLLLASIVVALAAVLNSVSTNLTPDMGFQIMFMGLAASIIGGIGSLKGAYFGSFVIAFLQQVTGWYWSAQWQDVGVFFVIIAFLILRPQGLFVFGNYQRQPLVT